MKVLEESSKKIVQLFISFIANNVNYSINQFIFMLLILLFIQKNYSKHDFDSKMIESLLEKASIEEFDVKIKIDHKVNFNSFTFLAYI